MFLYILAENALGAEAMPVSAFVGNLQSFKEQRHSIPPRSGSGSYPAAGIMECSRQIKVINSAPK
jgi:hypothetical protein